MASATSRGEQSSKEEEGSAMPEHLFPGYHLAGSRSSKYLQTCRYESESEVDAVSAGVAYRRPVQERAQLRPAAASRARPSDQTSTVSPSAGTSTSGAAASSSARVRTQWLIA